MLALNQRDRAYLLRRRVRQREEVVADESLLLVGVIRDHQHHASRVLSGSGPVVELMRLVRASSGVLQRLPQGGRARRWSSRDTRGE